TGGNQSDVGAYELQGPFETPGLVVTTASDVVNPYDGLISLREALLYAKVHAGADTITFDASLAGGTISLSLGELVINSDVTIDGDVHGDNKADLTIDAHGASRVFNVGSATATIDSLTMTGGATVGSGGAVYVSGALTIAHSTVSGSHAGDSGGGIATAT